MLPSLLIENGTVLGTGPAPTILHDHSVLIEDGRIVRVCPKGEMKRTADKRIDASRKLVLPGFINAHTHFYSSFARGLSKTKPATTFVDVLKNLWWRLDSALTTEDCYYSALLALLDSIRHGTTTIIDHHASPRAVVGSLAAIEKAVNETGLRACLCYELSDRDGEQITQQGLEENVSFIRHCQERKDDHLRALFGLHAAFTLGDRTLETAAKLGHDLGTGFHIHVAEAASDEEYSEKHFGMRVVERLKKFGILGRQTIAAHCVHVNPAEMDILAKTQTAVIHNPQSNMNNAVGVADVIGMSRAGILVGLGTDAMTTNMLEELRAALWAQHLSAKNPSVGFGEVATALFVNNPEIGERAFGFPVGELREGGVADIVVMDYDPPTPLESSNYWGHMVFGVSQVAVDATIVGGKVLMENKRLTLDIDEGRVNARARELAEKMWQRL
jgi:putative selenium metabolism protein SsnA